MKNSKLADRLNAETMIIREVDAEGKGVYQLWNSWDYIDFREDTKERLDHHEVICAGWPFKPFVDCEHEYKGGNDAEVVARFEAWLLMVERAMIDAVKDCFVPPQFAVLRQYKVAWLTRHRPGKVSAHLVMIEFLLPNYQFGQVWLQRVDALLDKEVYSEFAKALDMGVIKSMFNLSTAGNFRKGHEMKLKTPGVYFEETLLTNHECCEMLLPTDETEAQICAKVAPGEKIDSPEMKQIVEAIDAQGVFKFYRQTGNIWNFMRVRVGRGFKSNWCTICDRRHDTDNSLYLTLHGVHVYEHCRRLKGGQRLHAVLGPTVDVRALDDYIVGNADEEAKVWPLPKRVRGPWISEKVEELGEPGPVEMERAVMPSLPDDCDMIAVLAPMGAGKTEKLEEGLLRWNPERVLALSMRQTFTTSMMNRLQGFTDYRAVKESKIGYGHKRVLVQLESLQRIDWRPCDVDVLIVDEIESLLEQFFSSTMRGEGRERFLLFESYMKFAKRVVFMDANLSPETLAMWPAKLIEVSPKGHDELMQVTTSQKDYLDRFVAAVREGKRVFIPTNHGPKRCEVLRELIQREVPGTTVLAVHRETASADKQRVFANVNQEWKHQVVIVSPTCAAGVSFTEDWFDICMPIFGNDSLSVNGSRQLMRRVRNLRDKRIVVWFDKCESHARVGPTTYEDAVAHLNSRYNELKADVDFSAVDADGKRVLNESNWMKLFVRNTVRVNRDRQDFVGRFLAAERAANPALKVEVLTVAAPVKLETKSISQKLAGDRNAAIAGAETITREQYEQIRRKQDCSPDQYLAAQKFALVEMYEVPAEKVTPKFVETFNKTEVKSTFQIRQTLKGNTMANLRDRDLMRIRDDVEGDGSVTNPDVKRRDALTVLAKSRYERLVHLDAILKLLGLGTVNEPDSRTLIKRGDLEKKLRGFVTAEWIAKQRRVFEKGKAKSEVDDWPEKLWLMNVLRFTNCLLDMIGYNIVATSNKRVQYCLSDCYLKEFSELTTMKAIT